MRRLNAVQQQCIKPNILKTTINLSCIRFDNLNPNRTQPISFMPSVKLRSTIRRVSLCAVKIHGLDENTISDIGDLKAQFFDVDCHLLCRSVGRLVLPDHRNFSCCSIDAEQHYKAPETYKIWRSSLTVKADLFSVEPEKSRGATGRQESKPNRSVGVLRRARDGVEAAAGLKLREIGAVHG